MSFYLECDVCHGGFYTPTEPNGRLACHKCGSPAPTQITSVEADLPQTYWDAVCEMMSESGELALQCVIQGDEVLARYYAHSAAHNAVYIQEHRTVR